MKAVQICSSKNNKEFLNNINEKFPYNLFINQDYKDTIKSINVIKTQLNDTKNKLDNIYTKHKYAGKLMKSFDPFQHEKYKIAKKINAKNVTIAWLKGYELMYTFNLIPLTNDKFVYFDNASFPGSFILAANHIVNTMSVIKTFNWYASSLLNNVQSNIPLEDSYKLYANYTDNWLMHEHNNGDLSNWKNMLDFQKQLNTKEGNHAVDLYTCDLGMNVSYDYNNQEMIHAHLNLCQILCGLMVVKSGGNMLVKHYTLFEPYTISYISLLPLLFDVVYIVKPMTSKRTNSEVYIVCKNYLYPFTNNQQQIYNLFKQKAQTKDMTPLWNNHSNYYKHSLQSIKCIELANRTIFLTQKKSLNNYIYSINNIHKPVDSRRCENNLNIKNKYIRKQFLNVPIYKIKQHYNFQMKNVYHN
jgi:hypothetical protein